uniref:Retrovirus-related Pol polyprotein from transposon TNT 1-94 n=1 Tax=Tanacetum cinerariifolium TaxID=118510 RepID=A0A699GXN7_TANCI|nr:retrovirus-related Pol polyprotein from transposon TNT 1-94 [Tanacetum cinerariifolium]
MQQPMQNPKDITDPTTAMNMALALTAKAFKLNYSTPTNNNQRISSNPRNRQIAQLENANLNGNGNLVAARAERNAAGHNGNQIRCYNCRGKEEAGIQLKAEEFDLMAAVADRDEIEEVNANCILMANLQQALTVGTQTDKAPVYDSDGSAEVHDYANCDDNEIFNIFTQEEQYTELLKPISELHQVPQNDNDVISKVTSVEQSEEIVEQHPANFKETRALYDSLYQNLAIEVEKVSSVNRKLKEANADLTTELARFKNQEKCFEISQEKMTNLKDVINNTLQLALESPEKMKQLNKEIKPAYYTKINHLSGVFVSQTAKSREELYFSNDSKTANVSKTILLPNEKVLDDTTPSVARKFLNEVKSTIVTLQRVVKHRMTLETHNWSSSAHQELHKIVRDEIFPIVNQVDVRVQNFKIQFLKEAAKFIGDFKSLAKEADESLAKHKALELEIERLLRAVVSQDIMSVVQKEYVVDTSNLQTELERTKERFEKCMIKKENEYAKLWNDWINRFKTSRKEKHVPNTVRASARTKPITISQPPVINKKDVNSDSIDLSSTGIENTKTRRPQPRSNTKNDRAPSASKSSRSKNKEAEVEEHHRNLQLSKNTKHMPSACNNIKLDSLYVISKVVCAMCYLDLFRVRQLRLFQAHDWKLLINFVWKFMGIVRFRNDHVAAILGFGDLQWGNILITRVYFVEGLGHNLFSVGQFCDSDLEVAFRRNACFVKNLEGVDLLKRDRSTNLYTINLHEMASALPICLMARASSTKSWLWHQRLSHLNFDTINDLARNDLVSGLLKFNIIRNIFVLPRLHLLHMDLCGPMRMATINGKQYVLVIVDDYSRYTWVHFLTSKDEAPEVIKTFLKRIIVLLHVGISDQMSSVRTPQQNRVVERRNQTLVKVARTMLIFSRAPLFLWAEAIATACFTQNRSIIDRRFNKTPYELINDRKPDISFLYVFGDLCYPKNDREDIKKLGGKGYIGFFIGYSTDSCAYRIYNRRTKKIMETMNVSFDELSAMAFGIC